MRALRRASRLAALAVALLGATAAQAEPPERVVSINLCTDQLAMMLAAPGQLVSVSHVAADPRVSVMAGAAGGYRLNRGQAEEVQALAPDLVLAGPWTSRYTVGLLRRLGIEVRELPLAERIEEIPGIVTLIGDWLGREDAAAALNADFAASLAALTPAGEGAPRALLHQAGNYTLGAGTMAHQILALAGFANAAAEVGLEGGGYLPMEQVLMLAPDLLVSGQRYPGQTRAEAVLDHPAMAALRDRRAGAVSDADWVCGTPHVLRAVARLAALGGDLPRGDAP